MMEEEVLDELDTKDFTELSSRNVKHSDHSRNALASEIRGLREELSLLIRASINEAPQARRRNTSSKPRSLNVKASSKPRRVAIFGLGRTALAVSRSVLDHGAEVAIYDSRPRSEELSRQAAQISREINVPVILGWTGEFEEIASDLVIASPSIQPNHPRLKRAQKDGIPILSELEFAYRNSLAPIIAVTGTYGRKATALMTYEFLIAAGLDAIHCRSVLDSEPEASSIIEAFSDAQVGKVLVVEASSPQLEWVHRLRPKAAAITDINPSHFDRYKNFAEYVRTKHRVFARMGQGDVAVFNENDPLTQIERTKGMTIMRYGGPKNSKRLDAFESDDAIEVLGKRVLKSKLPLFGLPLYQNALCAALLAVAAGADPSPAWLIQGLQQFKFLPNLYEFLGERNGISFVNDSACFFPSHLINAMRHIEGPQRILLGGRLPPVDFRPVLSYLRESNHTAYIFGSDRNQMNRLLGGSWPTFETLPEAFAASLHDALPGETILLSPAAFSDSEFDDFIQRGKKFRTLVNEFLCAD